MTKTLCSGGVIGTIINKINKILFIIFVYSSCGLLYITT